MTSKSSRFQFDWYLIPKRAIYFTSIALAACLIAGGIGLYLLVFGGPLRNAVTEADAAAGGRFLSLDGDVRVVRAQTRQTLAAFQAMPLYPGDVVQTQADARARIQLADGSTLAVRPNSVVTVRDNSGAVLGEKPNVRVAVDRGQVNVRTQQLAEGASNVVETKQTRNKLAAQTGASFGVRDDNTEDIRISAGSVETATRGGEQTTVRAGEYLFINQAGQVARREHLLNTPQPVSPRDLETFLVIPKGTANASLRWQPSGTTNGNNAVNAATAYRVEVATSPFFVAAGKVVERGKLMGEELTVGELRPGVYFWRVRAEGATGQISEWSEPQKFFVTPNEARGPVSAHDFNVEYVGGNVYILRGATQAGNTVRSSGRIAKATSDGTFQMQLAVARGARDFGLEIEDPQGKRAQYRVPLETVVVK